MVWIDTHCHLDPQTYGGPEGVDAAVARAHAAGVTRLVHIACSPDPAAYARQLYATLHALDQRQLDRIVADPPPADEAWRAVADRLSRAAEPGADFA
jgi:L-threonylcarbamoyladenylate synthase